MTGRYQAYSEYHSTNDVHVRKLPIDWVMKPLGLVAAKGRTSFVDGPFGSDLKSNEYQDEGIPLIQLNNITIGKHILQNMKYITEEKMLQLSRHIAKPNDIVIAKMADPVARATVVNDKYEKYVIVADCVKLTVDTSIVDLNYVIHAINSKEVNSSAELVSTGTTRIRINLTEIKNLKIPFPPLVIQQKIASFLDHETAKIDTLIAKQEKLIELLKEKRQAVISHTVTRGLPSLNGSDTPIKDSGVEWLGEVPESWVVSHMDYVLNAIGDVDHYMPKSVEEGVPYVMTGDLTEFASSINFEDCKQVNRADYLKLSKKIKSSQGDVIMARYATIGTASYIDVDREFLVSYSCVTIKPNPSKVLGLYLFYYFKSHAFTQGIRSQINSNTQDNVGVNDLKKVKVVLPPLTEQLKIIEYLQSIIDKLDSLSKNAQLAINLMKERKTALISAAVTGKIDVRNWSQL